MIRLVVPYPPSTNVYWRIWRNRMLVSREARAYKQAVKWKAISLGLKNPLEGEVVLYLSVFRPQRSGDLSNRIKVIEDALEGVGYVNDKQVVEIHARRGDDKENPRVEVVVVPVEAGFPWPFSPVTTETITELNGDD